MSRPLPFTEGAVRRAIAAVRKAGIEVGAVSVARDGTVTIFQQGALAGPVASGQTPAAPPHSEWEDIKV
jgi:hypothetical protein